MRSRPRAASSGAARSKSAQLIDVRVDLVCPLGRHLRLAPLSTRPLGQVVRHRSAMLGSLQLGLGLAPELGGLVALLLEATPARFTNREEDDGEDDDCRDSDDDPHPGIHGLRVPGRPRL